MTRVEVRVTQEILFDFLY